MREHGPLSIRRLTARAAWRALLAATAALVALTTTRVAAAAAPPSDAPTFGEVVDVQLVTVEAVVLDGDGKTIPDLSAAEFQLFEDGAAVAIEHVELVGGSGPPRAGGVTVATSGLAAAEDAPLNLAVFLDEVHVSAASRLQMLRQMSEVLGKTLRKDDRVMVALYDGSTRVVLPFTSDRQALAAALLKAETVSLARLNAENDWRWTMAQLYEDAAGEHGWSPCLHIQEFVDAYAQDQLQQVGRAIDAFGNFVDSLAGIVGRKAVLHVSDGISTRPGSEAALYAQELCSETAAAQGTAESNYFPARTADIFDAQHHTTDSSAFDTSSRWEEVAARANAGNVTIYTFQAGRNDPPDMTDLTGGGARARSNPKAVHPPQKLTPATIAAQRANLQESLFVVADRSGGRAWLTGFDLARDLMSTVGELQTYYLLTYTPRARGGTEMRHLQVEVTRPGATVRSRKLYRPRTAHQQVADGLLGRLLYGSTREPSPLALELVGRQAGNQGKVKARFRLEVPVALLQLPTAPGTAVPSAFTAFAAVADDDGGTSPVRETKVPVRLGTGTDAPKQFVWEVEMLLRPGDHDVGMAVRNELTGETTFVVRHFAVRGR